MGPTASGKTDFALALAGHLPVEIVSVDSALVYRGMDIGTAKPPAEVLKAVPHHLIDVADPAEAYSAGRFREDALAAMEAIRGRGRLPLLAGGTMLYFRALERGLAELPPADEAVRRRIEKQASRQGWPAMHRALEAVDPASAARIRPTDSQRIQRALEVWELTGRPLSELQRAGTEGSGWTFLKFALAGADRDLLHRRIRQRFEAMLDAGLEAEVRRLHARGDLGPHLPSVRAVGYRQLWGWLEGDYTREEAVERAVTATRRLAKRQRTWLRSEPALEWLPDPPPEAAALAARIARWAGIPAGGLC